MEVTELVVELITLLDNETQRGRLVTGREEKSASDSR